MGIMAMTETKNRWLNLEKTEKKGNGWKMHTWMSVRCLVNVSAVLLSITGIAIGIQSGDGVFMVMNGLFAMLETACGVTLCSMDNSTIVTFFNFLCGKKEPTAEEKTKNALQDALEEIGEYLERNEFEALHGIEIDTSLDNLLTKLLDTARKHTRTEYLLKFNGKPVTLQDYGVLNEITLKVGEKTLRLSKEFFITEKFKLLRWWINAVNEEQDFRMWELQAQLSAMQRTVRRLERLLAHKNLEDSSSASDSQASEQGRHGLSESRINNLLTKVLKKDANDKCTICLEALEKDERVRVLGCGHIFHKFCGIRQWLKSHRTCPICKQDAVTGTDKRKIKANVTEAKTERIEPERKPKAEAEAEVERKRKVKAEAEVERKLQAERKRNVEAEQLEAERKRNVEAERRQQFWMERMRKDPKYCPRPKPDLATQQR